MPFEAGFADGSPAAALLNLLPRLGRAAAPAELRERFFSQENPLSLKALAVVSAELGLQARAFRADAASLGEVPVPSLVHLEHPALQQNAFVVLTGRDTAAISIEEGFPPQIHRFTPEEFARWWTGVVVNVTPASSESQPASPPSMGLLRRAVTWLRGGDLSIRYSEVARRLALLVIAALAISAPLLLAISRHGGWFAALAGGSAVAMVVASVVTHELLLRGRATRVPVSGSRLSDRFCKPGAGSDCDGVLSSRWATIAGLDVAALGYAFATSSVALLALGAFLPAPAQAAQLTWTAVSLALAAPAALFFIALQLGPLGRICPLCMAVHGAILLGLLLALPHAIAWTALTGAIAPLLPWAILHGLLFLGALGLLAPFVALGIEAQASRTRLSWVGTTPYGALAEAAGRPRSPHPLPATSAWLGEPSAPLRFDLLLHPQCPSCGPVIDKLQKLVDRHAALVAINLHYPVRDAISRADRELCIALTAAPTTELLAQVKSRFTEFVAAAEGGAATVLAHGGVEPQERAEALAAAAIAVDAATELQRRLARGTPTLLVGQRPWEGSVEDLDALLTHDPNLLASLLRLARPGAG